MHAMTLAALSWDPAIRGILVVTVAVLILPGSVYLLLSTNMGARVGLLIALAALFGWLSILGVIWTIYGKGVADQARLPHWAVLETVTGDLSQAATAQTHDLSHWRKLASDDTQRGDAEAVVSAELVGAGKPFEDQTKYVVVGAFDLGGARHGPFGLDFRPLNIWHDPHYAVIQAQAAKKVHVAPGATPPKPTPDASAPVISVVMERNLGNVRQRPMLLTLGCMILFAIFANALHRRDKLATLQRAQAAAPVT